jgi:hypothetical protein
MPAFADMTKEASMRLLLAFIGVVVFGAAAFAAEKMEAPKEMVVLTVGGEIAITNLPFDQQADSLFDRYKIEF